MDITAAKMRLRLLIAVLAAMGAAGDACAQQTLGKPVAAVPSPATAPGQFAPLRMVAEGTGHDVGLAVGRAHGEITRSLRPIFLLTAMIMTRQSAETLLSRAEELGKQLAPEDRDEIQGLAEGCGLAYRDVLFLNLFYSLTSGGLMCRQLAAWGPGTADGELMHARNLDWPDYPGKPLERNNLILNVKPKGGIEYLVLTWPGLAGVLTGTNKAGVTLAMNQLPRGKGERLAEPTIFSLKRALRTCKSADEVVRLLRRAKPLDNASILISDARAKTAIVVDLIDGNVGVRRADSGEHMIGNANHPTTDVAPPGEPGPGPDWPTCYAASKLGRPLDIQGMQQVMADPAVLQGINMISVIFAPARNKMFLSCGRMRAAEGAFIEYPLFGD